MHNKARYTYFYSASREAKLAGESDDDSDDDYGRRNRTTSSSKLVSSDEEDSDEDEAYASKLAAYESSRGK